MDRIGIDFISVFALPPVEYVNLAADLGCQYISTALAPMTSNPHNYPAWSLRNDATLRWDMVAAMRDRGVSITIAEGFIVRPGADVRDQAGDLGLLGELGVKRANIVSIDPDRSRSIDQLATFAEMTGKAGMEATLEFGPRLAIGTLDAALDAIQQIDQPHLKLVIDAMHFIRSGSRPADLKALSPGLIGYAQLCDVPLQSRYAEYMDEARFDRRAPSDGELPLLELVQALPRDIVLGLEIPMLAKAQAGIGPRERLAPCVKAARDLLARLGE